MNGWMFRHNGDPNDDVNGPFATNEDTTQVKRVAIVVAILLIILFLVTL